MSAQSRIPDKISVLRSVDVCDLHTGNITCRRVKEKDRILPAAAPGNRKVAEGNASACYLKQVHVFFCCDPDPEHPDSVYRRRFRYPYASESVRTASRRQPHLRKNIDRFLHCRRRVGSVSRTSEPLRITRRPAVSGKCSFSSEYLHRRRLNTAVKRDRTALCRLYHGTSSEFQGNVSGKLHLSADTVCSRRYAHRAPALRGIGRCGKKCIGAVG